MNSLKSSISPYAKGVAGAIITAATTIGAAWLATTLSEGLGVSETIIITALAPLWAALGFGAVYQAPKNAE